LSWPNLISCRIFIPEIFRIHARNHSYPTDTSAEELPILPQSLAPLSQPLEEDITEDVVFEQKVHEDQQLLEGAEIALPGLTKESQTRSESTLEEPPGNAIE